jgi:sulfate adenylyltransferase
MSDHLIASHGGKLINLLVDADRLARLKLDSREWPSWELTAGQLCDLELLLNGGFSPLRGFMTRADYEAVCASMRLADGTLWPIPIALDVPENLACTLGPGATLTLRDSEGVMLAALHVEDVWRPDRLAEASAVYGTTSREHPGAAYLLDQTHPYFVGGRLEGVQLPVHYDFRALRLTPVELRVEFVRLGWRRVVAFQTRNPMHRAHQELALRAAKDVEANLLIHPVVGRTKPGDVDQYTRVRCYQAILPYFPPHTVKLALLPLAMRMAGPREAVWHAIIRKNYGCTHFIVGRDHAGPGSDPTRRPFYDPYAAQDLVRVHEQELGVRVVPFREMVYVEDRDTYIPEDRLPSGARLRTLSGTELRRRLAEGQETPAWFTFGEVGRELRRRYPPRHRQGFTVFFTGLSGAGKSTLANVLLVKFLEMGGRPVTLLDGDIVRKHLSSELGFSKEHRDINSVRKEVRAMIEPWGGFLLVYVRTPLAVCEQRDRKGLYAKARSGLIREFTGISDPYEPPDDADVVVDTSDMTPEECAQEILLHLEREGYVGVNGAES